MPCRIRVERGSVTAEFAAVLPAVILVLIVALGAVQLAGEQLRLQAAVAQAARSVARGDSDAEADVAQVSSGATLRVRDEGDLVCARGTIPVAFGVLVGITLAATSCALADGQ